MPVLIPTPTTDTHFSLSCPHVSHPPCLCPCQPSPLPSKGPHCALTFKVECYIHCSGGNLIRVCCAPWCTLRMIGVGVEDAHILLSLRTIVNIIRSTCDVGGDGPPLPKRRGCLNWWRLCSCMRRSVLASASHAVHNIVTGSGSDSAATMCIVRLHHRCYVHVVSASKHIEGAIFGISSIVFVGASLCATVLTGAVIIVAIDVADGCKETAVRSIKDSQMSAVARRLRPRSQDNVMVLLVILFLNESSQYGRMPWLGNECGHDCRSGGDHGLWLYVFVQNNTQDLLYLPTI